MMQFLGSIGKLLPYFSGTITVTQATKKYAATGIGTGLAVGDTVLFAGFLDADSNGVKTAKTVAADEITVEEAVGANETAAANFKGQAAMAAMLFGKK
jgi:Na+/proline symporter